MRTVSGDVVPMDLLFVLWCSHSSTSTWCIQYAGDRSWNWNCETEGCQEKKKQLQLADEKQLEGRHLQMQDTATAESRLAKRIAYG